jgi:hypothetical protein
MQVLLPLLLCVSTLKRGDPAKANNRGPIVMAQLHIMARYGQICTAGVCAWFAGPALGAASSLGAHAVHRTFFFFFILDIFVRIAESNHLHAPCNISNVKKGDPARADDGGLGEVLLLESVGINMILDK